MSSVVYYIETDKKDSAKSVSEKLDRLISESKVLRFIRRNDFTGIKMHFGEEGSTGYIRAEWVKAVLKRVNAMTANAFLTDSNVLYKNSSRTNSVDHLKLAHRHGFGLNDMETPVLIADGLFGRNFTPVKIDKKHFAEVKIASDIASCDSLIVLSHVTGHIQTGLAAALKNLGMGCAARRGKYEQHCGIVPDIDVKFCSGCGLCATHCPASCITLEKGKAKIGRGSCIGCGECVVVCRTKAIETKWCETLENLQEKMVEYAYGVLQAVAKRASYVNFIIKVTKNCDCMPLDEPRMTDDLGILASDDPVSIDKASIDLVNERHGKDVLKGEYPEIDWTVQLKYAARIGLGSLDYKLERL